MQCDLSRELRFTYCDSTCPHFNNHAPSPSIFLQNNWILTKTKVLTLVSIIGLPLFLCIIIFVIKIRIICQLDIDDSHINDSTLLFIALSLPHSVPGKKDHHDHYHHYDHHHHNDSHHHHLSCSSGNWQSTFNIIHHSSLLLSGQLKHCS